MRRAGALALALALTLAAPALAQSQQDMNRQAAAEAAAADKQLNVAYKRVMARLDGPAQAALARAETKWIAFRDAESELTASPYSGGSLQPLIRAGALARLTTARTAQLAAAGPGRADPKADADLNRLYKELAADLGPDGRKLLLKAQLAWIAWRDAEAAYQALRFGGKPATAAEALTRTRAEHLQMHINAGEERP